MRLKIILAAAVAMGVLIGAAVSLAMPKPTPANVRQMQREVAVLLCSHHWTDKADGEIVVHHERPNEVAWCIHSYNTTGQIP